MRAYPPCPKCNGDRNPRCPVCDGVGVVIPMRVEAFARCMVAVEHLQARGMDTSEGRQMLGVSVTNWLRLHEGSLHIVELDRIERDAGVGA